MPHKSFVFLSLKTQGSWSKICKRTTVNRTWYWDQMRKPCTICTWKTVLLLWHLNNTSSSCVIKWNTKSHRVATQYLVLCLLGYHSTILVDLYRFKIFIRSWWTLLEHSYRALAIVDLYLNEWSRQKTVVLNLKLNAWLVNSRWRLNSSANSTKMRANRQNLLRKIKLLAAWQW
jgi:hypothetical protein